MNRLIGTIAGFILAGSIGSAIDPNMTAGMASAAGIMFSAAGLGFVLGSIADRQRVPGSK